MPFWFPAIWQINIVVVQHKKAISCHAKSKSLLKILISDKKKKYVV